MTKQDRKKVYDKLFQALEEMPLSKIQNDVPMLGVFVQAAKALKLIVEIDLKEINVEKPKKVRIRR